MTTVEDYTIGSRYKNVCKSTQRKAESTSQENEQVTSLIPVEKKYITMSYTNFQRILITNVFP